MTRAVVRWGTVAAYLTIMWCLMVLDRGLVSGVLAAAAGILVLVACAAWRDPDKRQAPVSRELVFVGKRKP